MIFAKYSSDSHFIKFVLFLFISPFYLVTWSQLPEPPVMPNEEKLVEKVEIIDLCGCMCEPQYPGGEAVLNDFLRNNLVYPIEALKNREHGKVYVQFDVNEDGSISNIVIARGVSYLLDQEAIRVIRKMPNWDSGYNPRTKRNVKIHARIPIRFEIIF